MASIVSTKGQVVIPLKFRREFGLDPGEKIEFKSESGKLVLHPAGPRKTGKIEDLRGMLKFKGKHPPPDFDVATLLGKGKNDRY